MGEAGAYLSIPFCKAKCSFCNFASDVFAADRMQGYVDRLCAEIRGTRGLARRLGAHLPERLDSIYFGGGTPSLLEPVLFQRIFEALRGEFGVLPGAEVTIECAPGQMGEATLEALLELGMNRVSFGVQSFVDRECAAVGRLHTRTQCLEEMQRMSRAGVRRLGLDLIVGLPHQTEASWTYSVAEALACGAEHVSLYMLEVDDDSRLGREALAQGSRYGAGALPDEDAAADWYLAGCAALEGGGVRQYEISNFARAGGESRHNLKYWHREPYVGFGLDAHSMLQADPLANGPAGDAVRWANPGEMEGYLGLAEPGDAGAGRLDARAGAQREVTRVGQDEAFEESLFLGLRLNEGVDMTRLRQQFGGALVDGAVERLADVAEAGLVEWKGIRLRLTDRGRMVSNEVFGQVLLAAT